MYRIAGFDQLREDYGKFKVDYRDCLLCNRHR